MWRGRRSSRGGGVAGKSRAERKGASHEKANWIGGVRRRPGPRPGSAGGGVPGFGRESGQCDFRGRLDRDARGRGTQALRPAAGHDRPAAGPAGHGQGRAEGNRRDRAAARERVPRAVHGRRGTGAGHAVAAVRPAGGARRLLEFADRSGGVGCARRRLAEALENAQLAIQRFETLGNAVRQASHNAGRLVAEAATANEKQKEFAQLEKMSQAALLQKIIAVQLATNELLGSLVQIQSLSAAGGTLASEERSRAWNAAARQLAEGRTEVETETARLESLRKAAALETGVDNLFSLDWTIQGS